MSDEIVILEYARPAGHLATGAALRQKRTRAATRHTVQRGPRRAHERIWKCSMRMGRQSAVASGSQSLHELPGWLGPLVTRAVPSRAQRTDTRESFSEEMGLPSCKLSSSATRLLRPVCASQTMTHAAPDGAIRASFVVKSKLVSLMLLCSAQQPSNPVLAKVKPVRMCASRLCSSCSLWGGCQL